MARITIVGSGQVIPHRPYNQTRADRSSVIGLATAAVLSRHHDITIVARNLPGDQLSKEWASPWAGANLIMGGCSSDREKQMQLDTFQQFWEWSIIHPEASVRRITIEDVFDDERPEEDIWWRKSMPEFRWLEKSELPRGAKSGISYKTIVLNPAIFLPWLKRRLEDTGVKFQRMSLDALSDASVIGHDVLVNATGTGSKSLRDINDQDVVGVRGQTMLVRSAHNKVFMRDDGETYTYVIPRLDGTVIIGGVRQWGDTSEDVNWDDCKDIARRVHKNLPDVFSDNPDDYDIVQHNVGFRPFRSSGIRVEKEVRNNQNIVHAYGFHSGGYICSFGVARAVRDLVEEFVFPSFDAKL